MRRSGKVRGENSCEKLSRVKAVRACWPSHAWPHNIISIYSTFQRKLFAFVDASSDKRIVQRCGPTCGYLQQFMRIYAIFPDDVYRWLIGLCDRIRWYMKILHFSQCVRRVRCLMVNGMGIGDAAPWDNWIKILDGKLLFVFIFRFLSVNRVLYLFARWQVDNDCAGCWYLRSLENTTIGHVIWSVISCPGFQINLTVDSWENVSQRENVHAWSML